MPSGTLIITVLLSVLIVLVLYALFLLLQKKSFNDANSTNNAEGIPEESTEVLKERIEARLSEIQNLQKQIAVSDNQLEQSRLDNISIREQLTEQQTILLQERKQHQEKLDLLLNAKEQMGHEFKNLANEILEQKGKAFTEVNKENIQNILKPLSEKILSFEKKVEETYDKESKERFSLAKEVQSLHELNNRISIEAVNLTKALKGESKTQGIWGEVILERVLEKSGLTKGREYEVQVNLKTDEGRLRQPDVVVHLPDKKDVIIDSKVSLTAYERYSSEENESQKNSYLKDHIQSIRSHIKGLSGKDYHQLAGIQSLDFVMMFLPIEAAFALGVQHDSELFSEAFEKNIILVGPSTLLATLRTIQNIWRYEHQNKNALEIAKRAGALYDKFAGFAEDLEDVGKRLHQTQASYDQAHKKLVSGKGNLVSNVEKLKELGARSSKIIPKSMLNDSENDEGLEINIQLEDYSDTEKEEEN